ncbi:MAG: S8 family peptidase [Ferrovibrio sp.]|uniref:S8 family peptidase n=1 Tax=Ferrovibrio sp. TaxID=1917215 RepID=UPI00391B771F
MRLKVLAALPAQGPLRAAAATFQKSGEASLLREQFRAPDFLQFEPVFTAIPIGSGQIAEAASFSSAEQAELFVVESEIEVSHPAEVPEQVNGAKLYADPVVEPFITCGNTPPVGDTNHIAGLLDVPALRQKQLTGDGVAIAIVDTGINLQHLRAALGFMPRFDAQNSWSPRNVPHNPGAYPVGHGTMCAYDALIAAPQATLVDIPVLRSQSPGGAAISGTLGEALQAFSWLLSKRAVTFDPGGLGGYKALVVNNSWGMYQPSWDFPPGHPGRYADNPNHPFNLITGVLARSGIDILFAAGNCGADCPDQRCQGRTANTIMGANSLPDVLTVAGCDRTGQRVGYSSQGPGIPGLHREKPDLTAYTHFLGSQAFGAGTPDSGTSTACPVAAGVVAALRSSNRAAPAAVPPANLFASLRAAANQRPGSPPWNPDYGHGIINPLATAQMMGL